MNSPIQALYQTGDTLYAVLISPVDGTVWNQTNSAWEAYNSAHWANYAVVMTEYAGSGYYRATYPIASPTFLTTEIVFVQAGGSPALGDPPATSIYQSQGTNTASVGNVWQAAVNLAASAGTMQVGAISGTPSSATLLPTNLANTHVGAYAGRLLFMTSGAVIQQASPITNYDGAGNITITGFISGQTPASGDTLVIV